MLRFLKVRLEAITDDFNNGLKAAQKEAKEFEKTIKPSKEFLKDVGTAASAAGLAVVGSMTAMAKAAANYGDELLDASKRTGASVQELARLKFAAEQSGASFSDVSSGLRVLAKNMEAAADGSKKQAQAFADLGIQVLDADGKLRPMNSLLLDVADRFSQMEDGAEKAALAQELFGRGGQALIPVLNEGRVGLKNMGDMAERLGLVISTDAAKAADEFNDTLDQSRAAMQGLANAVGQAVLPALTGIATKARDGIAAVGDFAREHEFLTKAALAAGLALTGTGGVLLGLAALVTIAPKVKLGIDLISAALAAASSNLAIFAGAKTYADIAAGVSLIGEASLAAKAGMLGLAAAIGIGIGSLVNWAIEGTRVRAAMDSIGERAGKLWFELTGGNAELLKATTQLNEALRKQGLEVERGTMSLEEWNLAVIKASQSSQNFTKATELQAKAQKEANDHHAFFLSISQGAAKSTGQVLDDLATSAKKAAEESRKLADDQMRAWEQAEEAREQMREHTLAIIAATKKAREDLADVEFDRINKEVEANRKQRTEMIKIWEAMADDRERIENENVAAYNKIVQSRIENEQHSLKLIADTQREVNEKAQRDREKSVEDQKRALERATADMKRSAGAVFDAMFLKGESVFQSLQNALKGGALSLGRAIFEDITGALLGPVKKAFDDFLAGVLGGITNKLGGALGNVLGIGTSVATTAAQTATGVATSAASAASSVGSSVAGAASLATGWMGLAGGVAGGIISGLMSMRQEGTLNAIEYNTRAAEIHQRVMIEYFFHAWHDHFKAIRDNTQTTTAQLDAIFNVLLGNSQADVQSMLRRLLEMLGLNSNGSLEELIKMIRAAAPGVVAGV